jgi:predicted RNase H-like nuclease (RuvC/YqgF family)
MQKNIVSAVNNALEKEATKPKTQNEFNQHVQKLREDINALKEENSSMAIDLDEVKRQNEDLKNKIEQLMAANATSSAKKNKNKRNKQ